ncbi:MAG: DUF2341 domain-containing protein [Verrucomicrobia bacterium]|nr:DUF2341 domain-containing protein [Verrucomicrobiota bacterium]MBU4246789.1 DUF2341 domain-containing protein [Verrucomicrobiota bacterium]MBU4290577.1 DUF2341 domain-containing protein [Verrucomicrobiota bacterium]MBU4496601.1 DUF2341 domain-containing protein [Verrucomicrobiota bacterium]MCG2681207.1 DUF2341 domain-containing protein [Kiritimatiellia bacterium]
MKRLLQLFTTLILVNIFILPASESQAALPFPKGWSYGQTITVDHTKVAANFTNFVILINLTNAILKDVTNGGHIAQSDGGDIRFENSSNVKLDHEIEKYIATNGQLVAWVKVDILSSNVDTVINMYYGSTDPNKQWNITNTWESRAKMVCHFNETLGDTNYDSTTNALNGTIEGASLITTGKVDGADYFDGINDRVNYGSFDYFRSTHTIEYWFYARTPGSPSWQSISAKFATASSVYYNHRIRFQSSSSTLILNAGSSNVSSSLIIQSNTWYHVAATRTPANLMSFYINGSLQGTTIAGELYATAANFYFADVNNGAWFRGTIDEARLYTRALSAAEILTQYNNQNSPSTFYSVGAEQRLNKGTFISVCELLHQGIFHQLLISDRFRFTFLSWFKSCIIFPL